MKDLSRLKSVGLHKLYGNRAAETALRLARYFGNSAQFWINLQSRYNLAVVEQNVNDKVIPEVEQAGM